jgi:hypothetical protein
MQDKNQFVYVLKLIPRLNDDSNWAQSDEDIVDRHFGRLKKYTEEGKVILAGRTLNSGPDTFGLVIFEAASEEEPPRSPWRRVPPHTTPRPSPPHRPRRPVPLPPGSPSPGPIASDAPGPRPTSVS